MQGSQAPLLVGAHTHEKWVQNGKSHVSPRLRIWGAKGSSGDSGPPMENRILHCLVSYKFAESSAITLRRTPQAAGELGVCPLMLLSGPSGEHMYRGAPVVFQWML